MSDTLMAGLLIGSTALMMVFGIVSSIRGDRQRNAVLDRIAERDPIWITQYGNDCHCPHCGKSLNQSPPAPVEPPAEDAPHDAHDEPVEPQNRH